MSIPILLDTDIGTDIDDVYALILAARSPELDLRAVTTVNSDVVTRAKIARQILRCAGRADVPVAVGEGRSLTTGVDLGWIGIEGQGIDLGGVVPDRDFAAPDAVEMLAQSTDRALQSGRPLTIITIGAMTNLALAIERYPDRMRGARRIVAMASTFEGFGSEKARPEHNVACDPEAVRRVLQFNVPVTFIGLNVTRQTRMDAHHVDRIEAAGGPLAKSLVGMHRIWLDHIRRDHSPMHDGLAVAAVFRPDLLEFRSVSADVRPPSAAVEFNSPRAAQVTECLVAESVNAGAFQALFMGRIMEAVTKSAEINQ